MYSACLQLCRAAAFTQGSPLETIAPPLVSLLLCRVVVLGVTVLEPPQSGLVAL